jgi:predicted peptidase
LTPDFQGNRSNAQKIIQIILALLLVTAPIHAQIAVDGFAARTFTSKNATMPYRLFVPGFPGRATRLPIVIYLHGVAGAGTDNLMQITGGNTPGTHLWIEPSMQARHPAFVVAPQLPVGGAWSASGPGLSLYAGLVIELVDNLAREFSIDTDRVYLVGQSLGGSGVWDLIAKRPDYFAGAVPLCGSGDPSRMAVRGRVAVWAFHGAKDEIVPVIRSQEMVDALRAMRRPVRYTVYPDVGHDVWTRAFSEPELPEWLFAQKRERDPHAPRH